MSNSSEQYQAYIITEAHPTPLTGSPEEVALFVQVVQHYFGSEEEEIDRLRDTFNPNPITEQEESECVAAAVVLLESVQCQELVRATAQLTRDQDENQVAECRYHELVCDETDPRSVATVVQRRGYRPKKSNPQL